MTSPNNHKLTARQSTLHLLFFLLSILYSSQLLAWGTELKVDGEPIPPELIEAYKETDHSGDDSCKTISDNRERYRLVSAWLRIKAAEKRGWKIDEKKASRIASLEQKLTEAKASGNIKDQQHYLSNILFTKSRVYWQNSIDPITKEDVQAEYNRLVELSDPRFVNVSFFRLMEMETRDEQYLQQLADRLRAGEFWRHISVDVDPTDWNSHNQDSWVLFEDIAGFSKETFRALKIQSDDLERNDFIGPWPLFDRHRLVVVLDKTIEPLIPINAEVKNRRNWAYDKIYYDLLWQQRRDVDATLLKDSTVTENNQPVTVTYENRTCP